MDLTYSAAENKNFPTIKAKFKAMDAERSIIRHKCAEYAHYTLPWIFPHADKTVTTYSEELAQPAGSIGARAVNHLANKIVSALFVPHMPFFKLAMSEEGYMAAQQTLRIDKALIDAALSQLEHKAMMQIESSQHKTAAVMVLKNLIITGNALVKYEDKKTHVYNFQDYVIRRGLTGTMQELLIEEYIRTERLDEDFCRYLEGLGRKPKGEHCKVPLYTHVYRDYSSPDKYVWKVKQEIEEEPIDIDNGMDSQYQPHDLPWISLTWNLVRGEDYGRGLVEDYVYAFHAHEVLSASQMQLFAFMSDRKFFVEPGVLPSAGKLDEIIRSAPGTYHELPKESIWTPELQTNDISLIDAKIQSLEREIAFAFLLNASAVRDSERTTAEEVRMLYQELETAHGGIYSRLATEWQEPLAHLLMSDLNVEAILDLPDVTMEVVTGIESMSRMGELQSIRDMFTDIGLLAQLPPEVIARIKQDALWTILGSYRGIDTTKFVKSEQEFAMEQQAMAQAEMQRQEQLVQTQAMSGAAAQMAGQEA